MAVWLVTGGNGFVGRHVLEALAAGVAESSSPTRRSSSWAGIAPRAARGIASSRPT